MQKRYDQSQLQIYFMQKHNAIEITLIFLMHLQTDKNTQLRVRQ